MADFFQGNMEVAKSNSGEPKGEKRMSWLIFDGRNRKIQAGARQRLRQVGSRNRVRPLFKV
jgi:hypothetical protein